jgi:hypothetical protein
MFDVDAGRVRRYVRLSVTTAARAAIDRDVVIDLDARGRTA